MLVVCFKKNIGGGIAALLFSAVLPILLGRWLVVNILINFSCLSDNLSVAKLVAVHSEAIGASVRGLLLWTGLN